MATGLSYIYFELFTYDQSYVQYSNKLYQTQRYPSGVFALLFLIVVKKAYNVYYQHFSIPFVLQINLNKLYSFNCDILRT